jgi:hypothetical protein
MRRDGDKAGSLVFSEPKNASRHTIDLPQRALKALRTHRKHQLEENIVAAPRDREAVLLEALKGRVYRQQGWLSPVMLVDGRTEGVWRHERKGDRLVVGIEPLVDQPGWVRRATEEETERLARFVAGELELGWSNP